MACDHTSITRNKTVRAAALLCSTFIKQTTEFHCNRIKLLQYLPKKDYIIQVLHNISYGQCSYSLWTVPLGAKRSWCEIHHSPPAAAKFENMWRLTSIPIHILHIFRYYGRYTASVLVPLRYKEDMFISKGQTDLVHHVRMSVPPSTPSNF